MKTLNKVMIIGRLATEPDLNIKKGELVDATFSVAILRVDQNGSQIAEFHKIKCEKQLAEITRSFLKKGQGVYVEGELRNVSNGKSKYYTEILADEINLLTI